jgi:hypothetical protein
MGGGRRRQSGTQLVSHAYIRAFQRHSNRLVFLGKAIPLAEY